MTPSLYKLEEGHPKVVYLPMGTLDTVMASDGKRASDHRAKGGRPGCGLRPQALARFKSFVRTAYLGLMQYLRYVLL